MAEAANPDVAIRLVHAVRDVKPLNAPCACCTDEALLRAEDEIDRIRKGIRVESVRVSSSTRSFTSTRPECWSRSEVTSQWVAGETPAT